MISTVTAELISVSILAAIAIITLSIIIYKELHPKSIFGTAMNDAEAGQHIVVSIPVNSPFPSINTYSNRFGMCIDDEPELKDEELY